MIGCRITTFYFCVKNKSYGEKKLHILTPWVICLKPSVPLPLPPRAELPRSKSGWQNRHPQHTEAALKTMGGSSEFQDITYTTTNTGAVYLFSSRYLEQDYATLGAERADT